MAAQKITKKVDPNRPCSRRDRLLGPRNHHPLDFCKNCQNETGSYAGDGRTQSKRAMEWLAEGSPRWYRCVGACEKRLPLSELSTHQRCASCETTYQKKCENVAKARKARHEPGFGGAVDARPLNFIPPEPSIDATVGAIEEQLRGAPTDFLRLCVAEYARRVETARAVLAQLGVRS